MVSLIKSNQFAIVTMWFVLKNAEEYIYISYVLQKNWLITIYG